MFAKEIASVTFSFADHPLLNRRDPEETHAGGDLDQVRHGGLDPLFRHSETLPVDAICEYQKQKRWREWILSPPVLLVAQRQCNATRYWIGLRLSTLIVLSFTVVSPATGLVAPNGISVVVTVLPSSVPV